MYSKLLAIIAALAFFTFNSAQADDDKKDGKVVVKMTKTDEATKANPQITVKTTEQTKFEKLTKFPFPKIELPKLEQKELTEEEMDKLFKKEQPSIDHSLSKERSIMVKGNAEFGTKSGRVKATALSNGVMFVALWSKSEHHSGEVFMIHRRGDTELLEQEESFPCADSDKKWKGSITAIQVKKGDTITIYVLKKFD